MINWKHVGSINNSNNNNNNRDLISSDQIKKKMEFQLKQNRTFIVLVGEPHAVTPHSLSNLSQITQQASSWLLTDLQNAHTDQHAVRLLEGSSAAFQQSCHLSHPTQREQSPQTDQSGGPTCFYTHKHTLIEVKRGVIITLALYLVTMRYDDRNEPPAGWFSSHRQVEQHWGEVHSPTGPLILRTIWGSGDDVVWRCWTETKNNTELLLRSLSAGCLKPPPTSTSHLPVPLLLLPLLLCPLPVMSLIKNSPPVRPQGGFS